MSEDRSMIFPKSEFVRRVSALQAGMEREGCAALLLTSPADIFYVTGFLTRFWESPARPWFVVIPRDGTPVAVIPSIGAALMARTWIDDIRCWDAPDPKDDGVSLLADALTQMAPGGRVGVPMGLETSLRMPLADYAALVETTGLEFADATDPFSLNSLKGVDHDQDETQQGQGAGARLDRRGGAVGARSAPPHGGGRAPTRKDRP